MSEVTSPEVKLFNIKLSKKGVSYHKSLRYEEIQDFISIDQYSKSYKEYITPAILYFTRDDSELAKFLGVRRVIPMGLYIRGVYGGEKKKGEKQYAGIALLSYRIVEGEFEFQLHNTTRALRVPLEIRDKHGVDVYQLIYVGEINPFCLRRFITVLLSRKGKEDLREFLREALDYSNTPSRPLPRGVRDRVSSLIEEVEQPSNIETLSPTSYYVVYRADRVFTACMVKPDEKTVLFSQVAGIEVESEEKALYYVAVLNYLAWKVVEGKRSFLHHQYGKPLTAIAVTGLCWDCVNQDIRDEVINLAKKLHNKNELCKEFSNQKNALKTLADMEEFKYITQKLDSVVDKQTLDRTLDLVSGRGKLR